MPGLTALIFQPQGETKCLLDSHNRLAHSFRYKTYRHPDRHEDTNARGKCTCTCSLMTQTHTACGLRGIVAAIKNWLAVIVSFSPKVKSQSVCVCVCVCVCVQNAGCRDERGWQKTPTVFHCHTDMEKSREGRDKGMVGQEIRLIHAVDKRSGEEYWIMRREEKRREEKRREEKRREEKRREEKRREEKRREAPHIGF